MAFPSLLLRFATVSLLLAAVDGANAEPLRWDAPRFRPAEYVATGVLASTTAAGMLLLEQNLNGPTGGVVFDDSVTEAATLASRSGRDRAVFWGDMGFYSALAFPVLDATVGAWAVRGSSDVAGQMLLIDAQAFALSGTISTATQKLVGRKRPFVKQCRADPDYDPDCAEPEAQSQSFLSGHTIIAFTGAGLTCAHHLNLELYGPLADPLTCAAGLGIATWVGTSRVVSARHYLSDVLSGAVIGLGSGWLMPTLLHYGAPRSDERATSVVVPWIGPQQIGVAWVGST